MDTQKFLAEFGHIANAPGGVAQLRQLILHLAISGDFFREHASVDAAPLLERIDDKKRNHPERKKVVAKQAPVPPNRVKAPRHWAGCRLGDLTLTITGGGTPSKNQPNYWNGSIPWASVKDLKDLIYLDKTEDHITEEGLINSSSNLIPPNRIIVCTRMGLGKAAINRVAMAINQDLKALELPSEVNPEFFLILYKTRKINGIGTTVTGIRQSQLLTLPAVLPPVEEQSHIVAKVDELMVLCDKLEAQQQKRRKLQNSLRQSILQAVAAATSPHELRASWMRLEVNFGQLFSEPEDVKHFKGLVLELAVNGLLLLTVSYRNLSASALLEAIVAARNEWAKTAENQELKEALMMQKKLRTQNIVPPSDPLPKHWCWASLLQVSQAVVDCHNKTAPYVAKGIHLVRTTDIRNGKMYLGKAKKISEETYAYWARRMPPKTGDIFFTREAPMGEAAIVPEGEKVCLGQRTMLIRLFPDLFSNRFLLYTIQSPSFQVRMKEAAIGMTVKHLRVGDVEDLMVPVPPKKEQDEIVEIVDHLFQITDHYAERLEKKQKTASDLALGVVTNLTGITTEQESGKAMKAPETELIAPIRLGTPPDLKSPAPLASILAHNNGELPARDLWQRFGGEIDTFYAQLKTEVAHGWIQKPAEAKMREKKIDETGV